MKHSISIEIFEEHTNCTFYTIRFKNDKSETDKFVDNYSDSKEFEKDFELFTYWIDTIGKKGALERYFRPEGGKLKALPIDSSKLRLYCFRISEEILIIGNGGIKKTQKIQEDPLFLLYSETLRKIGAYLISRIEKGTVSVYNNILYDNLEFTIEIADDKK